MGPSKVFGVPLSIRLAFLNILVTLVPILQQFVEEFHGEYFDLFDFFEGGNIHMASLGDVQKDSIQKEDIHLNIQVLAP